MKLFLGFIVMMVGVAGSLAADEGAPKATAPCSGLTQEEQQFASRLSMPQDQATFCQSMTAAQRAQVMSMAKPQPGSADAVLSPDQAMKKYSTQMGSQPQPTSPAAASSQKAPSGGGCPVQ